MSKKLLLSALSLLAFAPAAAHACACGCGVFDVGTGTMMPGGEGGSVWLEYDNINQTQNWSGTKSADKADNMDTQIVSHFLTAGGQYMFNRSWGAQIDVPYAFRTYRMMMDDGPMTSRNAALGDIRVKGIYTGLSEDMSTGLTYGLKVPTGDSRKAGFDRDTEIGTGSTDWLLGAYHVGKFTSESNFNWFANGQWQHAFTVRDHYRPGDDWNAAIGSYYNAGEVVGNDKIAPLLQLLGSYKLHDVGMNAMSGDSGYRRLMISPGVEYDIDVVRLYADVEVPIYQNVNGNQLTAPVMTKVVVAYSF